METIKNYLDNMFAGLPKSTRVTDLKNNILSNMEEKYNELKSQGKSENEAIGIVISEFGNIDELINELGFRKEEATNNKPVITKEETTKYLEAKKKLGLKIGIGVILVILAPASFILIRQLASVGYLSVSVDLGEVIGLISLFILVTAAVGLFIYSGLSMERYKYMELGVQIPDSVKEYLQQGFDSFTSTFTLSIILGVCLVLFSPVVIIVTSLVNEDASIYGVVALLSLVAIAVFLFIYFGAIRDSYTKLLSTNDYLIKPTKEDKVIGAVASIVWPLAVCIFLFCGFVYSLWNIAWIVFPITALLFGMFSAAYSILTGNHETK
jgi:hypothetical protein